MCDVIGCEHESEKAALRIEGYMEHLDKTTCVYLCDYHLQKARKLVKLLMVNVL